MGAEGDLAELGRLAGKATVSAQNVSDTAFYGGFYAVAYNWSGEKIISYRGTDGLNDITKGWTTGAGWTDSAHETGA